MFYTVERQTNVTINPSQLGPKYRHYINEMVRSDAEGSCDRLYGHTICVIDVLEILKGRIQDGTARIIVPVKYEALVFKPSKGDVIDGVVMSINKLGFFAQCGPMRTFVGQNRIPDTFDFRDGEFVANDGGAPIRVSGEVRVRLQGFDIKENGIVAVAAIDEDFLGPVEVDLVE